MTLQSGTHLRYALRRATSRAAQIAGTLVIAALAGAPAAVLLTRGEPSPLFYVMAGLFGVVAVLLLVSAVRQVLALRTRQTVVESDSDAFERGAQVDLYFRQPGPASFESFRVRLIGAEVAWSGKRHKSQFTHSLGEYDLFDSGPFDATAAVPFERTITVKIPDVPEPSRATNPVEWRLEVSGRVRGRADVRHTFPVTVR
jgi:hypothetical protein